MATVGDISVATERLNDQQARYGVYVDFSQPKSLSLGKSLECAIKPDSRVICWGHDGIPSIRDDLGLREGDGLEGLVVYGARLSRCTGKPLPKPPAEFVDVFVLGPNALTFHDNTALEMNLNAMQKRGMLPKESAVIKSILETNAVLSTDIKIVRDKIRACEVSSTDPMVYAVKNLVKIKAKLEQTIGHVLEAAGKTDLATSISTFEDLANLYQNAASVQALRDLRRYTK